LINKVEICGVNTSKLPMLSNEEKQGLLIKIKNGDIEAREEFIQGNLRLVLSVVQRFGGRGENPDDLFQIGCVGLIKAIDNFDPSLNVQFSTYRSSNDIPLVEIIHISSKTVGTSGFYSLVFLLKKLYFFYKLWYAK